jgi:hypothetical protein
MIQGFRVRNEQVYKGVDSNQLLPIPDEPSPHTISTQECLEYEARRNDS